jgi:hypothetical protein
MSRFAPAAGEELLLDLDGADRRFRAMPHPQGNGFVHAAEGAKAVVYRVREEPSGAEHALKVMKARFREPSLAPRCAALDALKHLPGMRVCERRCLAPGTAPGALAAFPALQYAVLMPWIQGHSWFEVLSYGPAAAPRDAAASRRLAASLARALAELEARGVAHCDLSAGNVIVDTAAGTAELVDVEDVYAPGVRRPAAVPLGTPGYQHRASGEGMWRADGDRFAGAVLLCEMLAWHHPAVRAVAAGESYFAAGEMQDPASPRLRALLDALAAQGDAAAAGLLRRAWASADPGGCPTLAEWDAALRAQRPVSRFSGRSIAATDEPGGLAWRPLPLRQPPRTQVRWSRTAPPPHPAASESEPDATADA